MFLPSGLTASQKAEEDRTAAYQRIEAWGLELVPQAIREQAQISCQEIQCGDPNCAPIDTAVTVLFAR